MTEAQWLACAEPRTLLAFLRGKVSQRKLRLFACGCYRCLHPLLPPETVEQREKSPLFTADVPLAPLPCPLP